MPHLPPAKPPRPEFPAARAQRQALRITSRDGGRCRLADRGRRNIAPRVLRGEGDLRSLWLSHTDADTRVGPRWLADQLELASRGADVVVGVVHLGSGSGDRHASYQVLYDKRIRPDGSHDHIHGANLGVRASAYVQAGGFPPLAAHEDRHLVRQLDHVAGITIVRSVRICVETSPRLAGRCTEGFAATLASLQPI